MKKTLLILFILITSMTIYWCNLNNLDKKNSNNDWISSWDIVSLNYVWKFDDWKIFDTNIVEAAKKNNLFREEVKYEPIKIPVWSWKNLGWIFNKIEENLIWMKKWDKKEITIESKDWFWDYDSNNTKNFELEKDVNFFWYQWIFKKIDDNNISFDFNHFLAWKSLIFDVEILENSNWKDKPIENLDNIKINYVWKTTDWKIFDTNIVEVAKENWIFNESRQYSPLEFVVWNWQMIPWMEKWVLWMKVWEKKQLNIQAKEWYWEPDSKNIINIIKWSTMNLWNYFVTFKDFSWNNIIFDLNHPYAWKTIKLELDIIEVNKK